ncbi:MAG: hypothetical protein QXL82_02485 [Candidatus Aenigmatarchaeota archaeon]
MRSFIFVSHGFTTYKIKDFYKAGRLDIAIHSIIHAFFISNALRSDVEFNLLLYGKPKPPIRIKIVSDLNTPWSKKDVGTLIKISLFKFYKKGEKPIEALRGVFVDRKGLKDVLEEYKERKFKIYLLDVSGKDINDVELSENSAFVIGDFLGLEKEHFEIAKNYSDEIISLGNAVYFASQCITILNYFYDRKFGCKYWDTSNRFKVNF